MKTTLSKCALLGMLACLSWGAHAQEDETGLLRPAVRCLAKEGFLKNAGATKMTFGALLDQKSDPGEKRLYVVYYKRPSRLAGAVFTIVATEHAGQQNFNILSRARFTRPTASDANVSFTSAPRGGTATQERLSAALEQLDKQPRVVISSKDLPAIDSSATCASYTDAQPKPGSK